MKYWFHLQKNCYNHSTLLALYLKKNLLTNIIYVNLWPLNLWDGTTAKHTVPPLTAENHPQARLTCRKLNTQPQVCGWFHTSLAQQMQTKYTTKLCLVYKNAKWVITCNSQHIISVNHKLSVICSESETPPFCNQVVWMREQLRAQFYFNISSSDIKIPEIQKFLQRHIILHVR